MCSSGTLPDSVMPELAQTERGGMGDRAAAMEDLEERAGEAAVESLSQMARADTWDRHLDLVAVLSAKGAVTDEEIVDAALAEWLAIEPPEYLRAHMLAHLARERKAFEIGDAPLLESARAEEILRRLAHLILSLPEAQLG